METTNIIAILLFIIPGVIAEKISNRMDMPGNRNTSDFGELVNGILLSIPIIATVGYVISRVEKIDNIPMFIGKFNEVNFILVFLLATVSAAIILGILKGLLKDKVINVVNFIRKKIFKKMDIDDKCCWRKMFLDESDSKYIEITVNGETLKGYTKSYSLPGDEKELIISTPIEWDDYPDIEQKFTKVRKIYINMEKNIIIKEFDQEDYKAYCEELHKQVITS